MQLPDEAISYDYQLALVPAATEWTASAELRAKHFIAPARLRDLSQRIVQIRGQVAAERDLQQVPAELQPLDAGFIDLPQKLLDQFRRKNEASELGRVLANGSRMREQAGTVVILGIGGSYMGARALFEALRSAYHNDLPAKTRIDVPRVFFEGNNVDNDALQELLDMLQVSCVDPEQRDERWGAVVISKSGGTLETAVAYRVLRREAAEYYGPRSPQAKELFIPITGAAGKLRDLCHAEG
jgi:glucose-6-phosphate isomerase